MSLVWEKLEHILEVLGDGGPDDKKPGRFEIELGDDEGLPLVPSQDLRGQFEPPRSWSSKQQPNPRLQFNKPPPSPEMYASFVEDFIYKMTNPQVKEQFKDAVAQFRRSGATIEQWSRLLQLAKAQAGE